MDLAVVAYWSSLCAPEWLRLVVSLRGWTRAGPGRELGLTAAVVSAAAFTFGWRLNKRVQDR